MLPQACQITFAGMDAAEPARLEVRAWLLRLGALTASLTGAHVVIEAFDERRQPRRYRVRMQLTMQQDEVVVTHDHPSNGAHEDLYIAIRNAFRAARRQLEGYFETRGGPPTIEAEPPIPVSDAVPFEPAPKDDHLTAWPGVPAAVS